jgi:nudix-type nucleoside diphosphatase (YffH/AdpP family)
VADRILASERVRSGWFGILSVKARLGRDEVERDVVEHPSGAAVLAYDPERRVALLVFQSRIPLLLAGAEKMPEAIAGALDGDQPEDCARREALEEAGVRLGTLEHVARVWPSPGTSTEQADYFLAEYGLEDRVAEGGGLAEEAEHIRVREMPLAKLWGLAEGGGVRDAKTLTLVQALRIRRPDLFG